MIHSEKDRDDNIIFHFPNRDVGFRVTTWVLKQSQKKIGASGVGQLLFRIGIDDGNIDMETLCTVAIECFNEYQHHTKGELTIDDREMCDMMDECGGVIGFLGLLTPGFESFIPKNSQPPQMVGEISQ